MAIVTTDIARMDIAFFERLSADPEFCEAMGRMTLAAGRLESDLRVYLMLRGVVPPPERTGFGSLIAALQGNGFVSENGVTVLRTIKTQRNYLTHSLYDLLSARVPETILPARDLIPLDVLSFTDKATSLADDLLHLSLIAERQIQALLAAARADPAIVDALLFRP